MGKNRLIYGVAVNDADYRINHWEHLGRVNGVQKQRLVWRCPVWSLWRSMVERCYSDKYKLKDPNYKDCTSSEDWKYFSKFKTCVDGQEWAGLHLDKDLLVPNNKIYSADTCHFVTREVNNFIQDFRKSRAMLPPGVCVDRTRGNYFSAECHDRWLGRHTNAWDAHMCWLEEKRILARDLAARQKSELVANALIDRYDNFHAHFGYRLSNWMEASIES